MHFSIYCTTMKSLFIFIIKGLFIMKSTKYIRNLTILAIFLITFFCSKSSEVLNTANAQSSDSHSANDLFIKNPFLAPAKVNNNHTSPQQKKVALPVLKGTIICFKKIAIIEYQNQSNFYYEGQCIGPYKLEKITSTSVQLNNNQTVLTLTIEDQK